MSLQSLAVVTKEDNEPESVHSTAEAKYESLRLPVLISARHPHSLIRNVTAQAEAPGT